MELNSKQQPSRTGGLEKMTRGDRLELLTQRNLATQEERKHDREETTQAQNKKWDETKQGDVVQGNKESGPEKRMDDTRKDSRTTQTLTPET